MKQEKRFDLRMLISTGLFGALVFIFSWVQIPLAGTTRIHLGNVFCALAGLLLGPAVGGLSAGLGSMLFDFTNPAYIAESWITFLTKFCIGFLAGCISHKPPHTVLKDAAGAAAGCICYVALYLMKSMVVMLFIEQQAWQAVQVQLATKGAASLVNALAAVVVSVLLARAMRPALQKAGIFEKKTV